MSTPQASSTPQKYSLSTECIHAITILLGHPLTSEVGQHIQKWIIYQANLSHTKFAFKWDPLQFEETKHLQKYEETNGSISYLKSNTVKQLVSLKIYMILLICQDRPADQNYHPTHFIKGEQLFKLTAIDLKRALLNEMFESPRSQTTFRALMYKITPPSPSASMRSPTYVELAVFKKGIKSDYPHQNVDKPHLSASISTITNLDVTCTLDTPCDPLLHLDPPSHSSDPQDISSVENVEIEFLPESEGQQDHTNLSPTYVFSGHHDYELFLLQKEVDAPNGNLKHQDTHHCENQDDILIHATILSHTFTLPQLMAEHNCEYLNPSDTPSTVSTAILVTCDQSFNPRCDHTQGQLSAINLNILTLSTTLHYHNSWHNPTLKTWRPLILQVNYQPLSKPAVITPSTPNVLIT